MNNCKCIILLAARSREFVYQKRLVYSYSPRRSVIFVGADNMKRINSWIHEDIDSFALDLDSEVLANRKEVARKAMRIFLNKGKPNKSKKYDLAVRINSPQTKMADEDLKMALSGINVPDTIILPNVKSAEDIKWFSERVTDYMKKQKKLDLIIVIQSGLGVINLGSICTKAKEFENAGSFQAAALAFRIGSFCLDIGASPSKGAQEAFTARQLVVLHAKTHGMQAIDFAYIKINDIAGLYKQCENSVAFGFTGKIILHPGQAPVVQSAFMPPEKHIREAQALVKSAKAQHKKGLPDFHFKGNLIKPSAVQAAQDMLNYVDYIRKPVKWKRTKKRLMIHLRI